MHLHRLGSRGCRVGLGADDRGFQVRASLVRLCRVGTPRPNHHEREVVDMEHVEKLAVDAPTEEVWALIGDVRAWPRWLGDISDVHLEDGELSEGSEVTYHYRDRPTTATISTYVEGRTIAISTREKRYAFAESLTVHPSGDGSEVLFRMRVDPTAAWMRVLAAVVTPIKGLLMGPSMRKELRGLERALNDG